MRSSLVMAAFVQGVYKDTRAFERPLHVVQANLERLYCFQVCESVQKM
jgi:hypothetical protein